MASFRGKKECFAFPYDFVNVSLQIPWHGKILHRRGNEDMGGTPTGLFSMESPVNFDQTVHVQHARRRLQA